MFPDGGGFDVVTVIPAKQGKDPRLERLLDGIAIALKSHSVPSRTARMVFFTYLADARSQKSIHANERRIEANRSLQLIHCICEETERKALLVIDECRHYRVDIGFEHAGFCLKRAPKCCRSRLGQDRQHHGR